MKDFLLEIGVEPFPARFIPGTMSQLQSKVEALLKAERLAAKGVRVHATHRRLAVLIEGLAEKSEPLHKEALGPSAKLLKDAAGNFTPQAQGFARGQGVRPEELLVVQSPKGEVLCAKKTLPGEAAERVLLRALPGLIASLEFPKNLVWDATRFRFGRPIRNLLALYGNKPLKLALAGVAAGKTVQGLMALGSKPVKVAAPAKYARALRDACILVDVEDRREAARKTVERAAKQHGVAADADAALLEETVYVTEHPVAVPGTFDAAYLKVPEELLALTMKKQLKFFPTRDRAGKLTNRFIGVRDGISEDQGVVQTGFQRVLAARLADALFFYEKDLKTTLAEKRERLKDIAYLQGFGSTWDKSERVAALAARVAQALALPEPEAHAAKQAGELAYADLVSEVVREFPELQGLMGGVYAERQGHPKIADALYDFYLPAGPGTPLPRSPLGAIVSLAGKLDTLAVQFAAGNIPSGSEDPFALRRQAAGAVRIVLERGWALDIGRLAKEHVMELRNRYAEAVKDPTAATHALEGFLWGRVEAAFAEQGFASDEIRAVQHGAFEDLPRALKRLKALHATRKVAEFESLAAAFKRASNILRQAKWDLKVQNHLDPQKFQTPEETALWDALLKVSEGLDPKLQSGDYAGGLKDLVALKEPLDRFFEKVMVMADDPAVKNNRLALLSRLANLFTCIADLSKLQ